MRVEDLTLEVRDRTLKRVGQITEPHMDFRAKTVWCGVGEWSLNLPGSHPMVPYLATPGSGVLLLGPDGTADNVILSGPTRIPKRVRNRQNPDGTYTFSGVTDEVVLAGALAAPDTTVALNGAATKSNDTRTAATEDILRQYVAYNLLSTHAHPSRIRGLRQYLSLQGGTLNRGLTQQKSPRYQRLLEVLQEAIAYDPSLGFRVVQIGGALKFQVLDSRDRTAFVRFDIENGTLTSEEVQFSGPTVTDAIVAGQGEGTARQIVRRQTADSIAAEEEWGVPFEFFVDQRDTAVLAELQQSGDEALQEGVGGTAVKMVPADDTTMQVGTDWRAGDAVTTVVNGAETVARVTEVAYSVTSSGVMAGAALGDVSGFTARDAETSKVLGLDQRVSNLERASVGPVSNAQLPARITDMGRGTTAERDAYFGTPGTLAAQVALANRNPVWWNTTLGWEESYYVPAGSAGLTARGLRVATNVPAGWYPTGAGPRIFLVPNAPQTLTTGNIFVNWATPQTVASPVGGSWRNGNNTDHLNFASGLVRAKIAGRYKVAAKIQVQNGAGAGVLGLRLYNAANVHAWTLAQDTVVLHASHGTFFKMNVEDWYLGVDESIRVAADSVGSAIFAQGADGTNPSMASYHMEYLGPPLVGQ